MSDQRPDENENTGSGDKAAPQVMPDKPGSEPKIDTDSKTDRLPGNQGDKPSVGD